MRLLLIRLDYIRLKDDRGRLTRKLRERESEREKFFEILSGSQCEWVSEMCGMNLKNLTDVVKVYTASGSREQLCVYIGNWSVGSNWIKIWSQV